MSSPGAPVSPPDSSKALIRGVLIAIVAMVLFSSAHSSVRSLSDTMTAYQIVFWRMAVSMAMLMPFYAWKGFHHLHSRRVSMHAQRAVLNFVGMLLWFYAIGVVPLGKAVAIHFTLPLFVLLLAALVLGEKVGPRRVGATFVGFCGTLIILRPGLADVGLPEAMILGSAALYAATVIYLKKMVATETPLALTFYTNAFIFLFSIPAALYYWVPATTADIIPILVVGILGTAAPFLFTTALRSADASVIATLDFLRLPFTAGLAYALFDEVPEIWVWVGGAVIFFSTYYITMRESRLAREREIATASKELAADRTPEDVPRDKS